jgi:hypothetical protein
MYALNYLTGVSSSEKLCWRTPLGTSCLEIAGLDGIDCVHPYFLDRLVLEGALRSSVVFCHHRAHLLRSMVKSEVENGMEAEF